MLSEWNPLTPKAAARGLVLSLAAILAGGCASTSESTGEPRRMARGNDCFWENTVSGWKVIDDRTIVVWPIGKRKGYRVSLEPGCSGLDFAPQLGFLDNDGRICGFGGDAIYLDRAGAGG